ncbi:MAG: YHYH domain-containing protein, partial [Bacilli bacterium]
MKFLKRILTTTLIVSILISVLSINIKAHPGNTDSSGCHTCKTNCTEKWGLAYGEYHCHTPKRNPEAEAPAPAPAPTPYVEANPTTEAVPEAVVEPKSSNTNISEIKINGINQDAKSESISLKTKSNKVSAVIKLEDEKSKVELEGFDNLKEGVNNAK